MKKNNKQRLFEVMSRLDKTFKPKLNEDITNIDKRENLEYFLSYNNDDIYWKWVNDEISDNNAIQIIRDIDGIEYNPNIDYKKEYSSMSEDIFKDDSATSKMFRDTAKAFDPKGYEERLKKERPNQTEPEVKPKATNQFKKDLNENPNNDLVEYEIPSWAISALINGDYSGLEDDEITKLNDFIQEVTNAHGNAHFMIDDIEGKDNLGFQSYNDIDNLGGDVYRLYIRPDEETNIKKQPFNKKLRGGEYYMKENNLNERKPADINPKYTHFALLKDSKKFVNGWDFKGVDPEDLKQDKMHYFFNDIIDMDINPKNVLVGTVKKFQKEGLDPFDSNNWYKFNADGWQERDDLNEDTSTFQNMEQAEDYLTNYNMQAKDEGNSDIGFIRKYAGKHPNGSIAIVVEDGKILFFNSLLSANNHLDTINYTSTVK